ncbi:receptor-type protein kinase, putative [Bodo saltans]|uniref:Receptor-type protein kinase, putative n=1 Tax=Bodo saltans TaxID=75058 RepID=A0A0S4JU14_BODSA|nr:receptor-type protein kinase, putative [Bodo saltans]|eukprot:CUG92046.1 receptor-type protein kinase, putative [Bodo saltans]
MSSVSDFECSAPQFLLLSADRVALGTSIAASGGALWKGVVRTTGQPDRIVAIRRALGAARAGSVARRVAALRRSCCVGVVGVIDVTPSESYVVMEYEERDGTMLLPPQASANFLFLPRVTTLRRLQRLDLSVSHDITDAGLMSVAALQQLRHLDFSCNDNITDAGIANLSSLKLLRCLHLSQCDSITGAGLASVAFSLQHLCPQAVRQSHRCRAC